MKLNATPQQIIAMALVLLGAITGGTAQLTNVIGAGSTQIVVSLASLGTTILSGWMMIITGQSGVLQQVQAMPGVEKIMVNAKANQTLASLAVDDKQEKIEAMPAAAQAVAATAKS